MRVAATLDRQALAQQRAQHHQGEQAADPEDDGDQVDRQGVDGRVVVAEPAAWPASASGRTASTLNAASATIAPRWRATDAPIATTSARPRLIAATRRTSIDRTNDWNCVANAGVGQRGRGDVGEGQDRRPARAATTQTTADAEAQRVAVTRRLVAVVSGMIVRGEHEQAHGQGRRDVVDGAHDRQAPAHEHAGVGEARDGRGHGPGEQDGGHHDGHGRQRHQPHRRPGDLGPVGLGGVRRWPWVPA